MFISTSMLVAIYGIYCLNKWANTPAGPTAEEARMNNLDYHNMMMAKAKAARIARENAAK